MDRDRKKICLIGTGGAARDAFCCLVDQLTARYGAIKMEDFACFMIRDDEFTQHELMGVQVIKDSEFNPALYDVVVAIGDSMIRKKVAEKLPPETTFATIIHPSVVISSWVEIGEGAIIAAGCILTCNIRIGKHCQLNMQTAIGHDCSIGDYFSSAPSVNLSGNCTIGDCVYLGTQAALRQGVTICDNVTVGMGGIVLKDITESGVYIGSPVKRLEQR